MTTHFSGSYAQKDVQFLLTPLTAVDMLDVRSKESHIQKGGHYSEVLSPESAPKSEYMRLFREQMTKQVPRLAQDLMRLAIQIVDKVPSGPIGLVSLARAGTPMGVLLRRTLSSVFARDVDHYSVSIIRDRGLDLNALRHVRSRHTDKNIVFVDGWTGKGVIGDELRKSVNLFNDMYSAQVDPSLFVVSDIAGTAQYRATRDDYLLPSAILNSTVSGLVSRTVLNDLIGPEDFHGCVFFKELAEHDVSRLFVDYVWNVLRSIDPRAMVAISVRPCVKTMTVGAGGAIRALVAELCEKHKLANRNFIKPGVGEATRVLLRRVPQLLIVQDLQDRDVAHLLHLAAEKAVPVETDKYLPCRAVALIEQID
ncbi:cysteine protease StiP family protein [Nostoc sp. CHAB 5834]|nr:cysteine protease StiP family protein [Nostoc sp. CHAB 5834]